jgi:GntR family transcriptional regulator, transcriptional repressor for pyruvate dehydrogenase complex
MAVKAKGSGRRAAPEQIRRERLSERVVQVIEGYITRNGLRRGDQLPSERELAEKINVGTRSIREALKTLEARGVVRIVQGKGSFVDERYRDDFIKVLADTLELTFKGDRGLLLELMYVRMLMETSVVADVAEKRTAEHVKRLAGVLALLQESSDAGDIDEYNRRDALFHKTIIDALDNRILTAIYDRLNALLLLSFETTGYLRGSPRRSLREHAELFEAIERKDRAAAAEFMRRHLEQTTRSLASHIEGLS